MITATHDLQLGARITNAVALHYTSGADATIERPLAVRAGSSLARLGGRIVVAQDDAAFLALLDLATLRVDPVTLPAGADGRRIFEARQGNKQFKYDFEACCVVAVGGEELLLVFGSGSTPRRERVALLRFVDHQPVVTIVDAHALYAQLRAATDFAGSELNIEGVIFTGAVLRFFNRGNGDPHGQITPVNATCEIPWHALANLLLNGGTTAMPAPTTIVQYDLGAVASCALTFTDATIAAGVVLYSAAAEASPNAIDDGPTTGAALGVIAANCTARYTLLTEANGSPSLRKVEGVLFDPARPTELLLVVDNDDPDAAADLCTVELRGPWWVPT